MGFDDLFLRRTFLIIAMNRSRRYDFHVNKDIKVIDKIIDAVEEDASNHYLAVSKDDGQTMISFAAKPENKYNDKKRVRTTLGKYIRKQLNVSYADLSDYNLERFCKSVMNTANGNVKYVTIYSGKELKEYFRTLNIKARNLSTREILFYTANEKKVAWVVAANFARALLWNCDDGTKILDVIYPKKDVHHKQITEWARQNNVKMASDMPKSELNKLRITMKCRYVNELPPQDTFKYGEIDRNKKEQIVLAADPIFGNLHVGPEFKPYYRELPCKGCGKLSSPVRVLSKVEDNWYCSECIEKTFKFCNCCNNYRIISEIGHKEEGYSKHERDKRFVIPLAWVCESCIGNSAYFSECHVCGIYHHEMCMAKVAISYSPKHVCRKCLDNYVDKCSKCTKIDVVQFKYGRNLCRECIKDYVQCKFCNRFDSKYTMSDVIMQGTKLKDAICATCKQDKTRCQSCWSYLINTAYFEISDAYCSYKTKQAYCPECKKKEDDRRVTRNHCRAPYYQSGYNPAKQRAVLKTPGTSKPEGKPSPYSKGDVIVADSTGVHVRKPGVHTHTDGLAAYPGFPTKNPKSGHYGMN